MTKFKPKKISDQGCMKYPIQTLSTTLFSKLDTFPEFLTVDEVLVENQPSLLNPTMKTISAVLFSYFVMRGFTDKDRTKSKIQNVKFTSPTNKLEINKTKTTKELGEAKNKRNKYDITKGLGLLYCKYLIDDKDLKTLNEYTKKDDMCDAFLQGFHHMFKIIPDEYVKKLESIPDNLLVVKKPKRATKTKKEIVKTGDNDDIEEESSEKITSSPKPKTKLKTQKNIEEKPKKKSK
jgi:hypothetical protein